MDARLTLSLLGDKMRQATASKRAIYIDVPDENGTFTRYDVGTIDITTDSRDGAWHVVITCSKGEEITVTAGLR